MLEKMGHIIGMVQCVIPEHPFSTKKGAVARESERRFTLNWMNMNAF